MKLKMKKWYWKLTWPFAHANYTTIWNTIYCPNDSKITLSTVKHEEIHYAQQKRWGWFFLPLWIVCYLLFLPFLWNPFRYKWEYEAFYKGSRYSHNDIVKILKSRAYGWLLLHGKIKGY